MQQVSHLDSTTLHAPRQLKVAWRGSMDIIASSQNCGCSSVGRAPPCQGGRREFEPRHPLQLSLGALHKSGGWSAWAGAYSEGGPPDRLKLRLAGRPCDALGSPVKVAGSSETVIPGINARP